MEVADFVIAGIANKEGVFFVVVAAGVAHIRPLGDQFGVIGLIYLVLWFNRDRLQDHAVLNFVYCRIFTFAQGTGVGHIAPFENALEAE